MAKVCIKLLVTGIILFIVGIIGMAVLEVNGYDAVYSLPVKNNATNTISEVAVVDGGYTYYWDGEDDDFFTVNLENADTVRGLDIDVSAGSFNVMTGNELSISGTEVDLDRLEYYIENGVLHVSYSPGFYLFNWDFDGINNFGDADIIITLPPEMYDTANFTVKAGELTVIDFETASLYIDLAAGEHYFSNVSAAKSAQIKMTAGNCTFENCVFNNADIKMTAGEMYLSFCELI
ncbi:MAG: DUF4097 domain-containing protein, partial [Ruminococcus sp.]|nr:DUF4097 domain-containing protein [Ruminococcus sp.]